MTTPGKYHHLLQCSDPDGHFTILAIDHRDNLLESLNINAPNPLTPDEFAAFKQQVMRTLAPAATAILTDPQYGIGFGIASGNLNGRIGLLSPLEVTDYSIHPSNHDTKLIEDWSIGKVKRIGGAGVKLLLYYHPGALNAAEQRLLVEQIVEQCTYYDLPFFLEPIAYSLDSSKQLSTLERRQVVVESVHTFCELGVDVLKVEFPVNVNEDVDERTWFEALRDLNSACSVPWALLSAGETYKVFRRQTELACQMGASGVMVGRSVWAEAVSLQGRARQEFLSTTALERLRELAGICKNSGSSWRTKTTAPEVSAGWYTEYEDLGC